MITMKISMLTYRASETLPDDLILRNSRFGWASLVVGSLVVIGGRFFFALASWDRQRTHIHKFRTYLSLDCSRLTPSLGDGPSRVHSIAEHQLKFQVLKEATDSILGSLESWPRVGERRRHCVDRNLHQKMPTQQ